MTGLSNELFYQGTFSRTLNVTFLVLILKKKIRIEDLKDFRLINLVGGLYKLLVKVLANMLKKVEGKVVSAYEHGFVEDRYILDVDFFANASLIQC